MPDIDMTKLRRETIRWNLLRALDYARPVGTHEGVLLATIQGLYPDTTQHEIRRELDYLESRDLISISEKHSGSWRAELERYGIDLVEYSVECEAGIARPAKF